MKIAGSQVWIIGASAGIGEHVAYECARRNADRIFLSSRNIDALEKVASTCRELGTDTVVVPLDVTDTQAIDTACDRVLAEGTIDILINNAGVSQRALLTDSTTEVDRKLMDLNYFGLVQITKRVLPSMLSRKRGHIAVTTSPVGYFGFPLRSAYAAAKHALHGFFETLYLENKKYGIRVTFVCPGTVQTDVSRNALQGDGTAHGAMAARQAKGMTPEDCAKRYVKGIERNKKEVFMGRETILIYLRKFAPAIFYRIAERVDPK